MFVDHICPPDTTSGSVGKTLQGTEMTKQTVTMSTQSSRSNLWPGYTGSRSVWVDLLDTGAFDSLRWQLLYRQTEKQKETGFSLLHYSQLPGKRSE